MDFVSVLAMMDIHYPIVYQSWYYIWYFVIFS